MCHRNNISTSFFLFIQRASSTKTSTEDACTFSTWQDGARIAGEAAARRRASTAVSSLAYQISAFHAPPGAKHDHGISPFLSMGRPHYVEKARLMPGGNSFGWRARMKWPISHLRSSGILGASVLIFASLFSSQLALGSTQIIPPDRNFPWNPGMMSKGGIPNRTTICATLSPSGGDQSAAIQAALDSCPSNQVVMLNPGTFIVNNYVLIHSPITLRGSGAGVTILNKANGAHARLSTVVSGTNGIHTPQDPGSYTYDTQPIVIVGPSRWPAPDNSTSQSLSVDGQQGAYSVTIANARGYAAGNICFAR